MRLKFKIFGYEMYLSCVCGTHDKLEYHGMTSNGYRIIITICEKDMHLKTLIEGE